MIEVRAGSLADNIDNMTALMQANWDETGFDFPFKLDTELYKRFEALGILLVVGAFKGDEVIGYTLASVLPHPFNPEVIFCNSDVLFVHRDYRNTSAGARMMALIRKLAKERGVKRIFWHARGDTAFAETLRKRGMHLADEVFMEGIENGS